MANARSIKHTSNASLLNLPAELMAKVIDDEELLLPDLAYLAFSCEHMALKIEQRPFTKYNSAARKWLRTQGVCPYQGVQKIVWEAERFELDLLSRLARDGAANFKLCNYCYIFSSTSKQENHQRDIVRARKLAKKLPISTIIDDDGQLLIKEMQSFLTNNTNHQINMMKWTENPSSCSMRPDCFVTLLSTADQIYYQHSLLTTDQKWSNDGSCTGCENLFCTYVEGSFVTVPTIMDYSEMRRIGW